jgi:hypothetical protein
MSFPTLRCSELEISSEIITQLFVCKQVSPLSVLTRVRIGKHAAGLAQNSNCTNIAQNPKNRL